MRMRFKGAVIFNILFIILFAVAIVIALGYNSRARSAPLVIAIPGLAVTVGRLVVELRGGKEKKSKNKHEDQHQIDPGTDTVAAAAPETISAPEAEKIKPAAKFSELNSFLWVAGLPILLYVVGFMAAIPIYLFLFQKIRSHEKLLFTIIFSLVSWGALYLFFGSLLHIPLYEGIIAETFF